MTSTRAQIDRLAGRLQLLQEDTRSAVGRENTSIARARESKGVEPSMPVTPYWARPSFKIRPTEMCQ